VKTSFIQNISFFNLNFNKFPKFKRTHQSKSHTSIKDTTLKTRSKTIQGKIKQKSIETKPKTPQEANQKIDQEKQTIAILIEQTESFLELRDLVIRQLIRHFSFEK
jgi:transposase